MRNRYRLIILLMLIGVLSLTSCGSPTTATSWPGMTLANNMVYLSYATGVYAINPSNGTQAWKYPEKADNTKTFYAAPVLMGDQLIVGDYKGVLHSLNAGNGTERWTFTANSHWVASPLVVGETIYAPAADNTLYALNQTGQLLWKFTAKKPLWSQPAADGEYLYLSSMDHMLYKISMKDGVKVWEIDLGGSLVATPLVENGVVYIGSVASQMAAVDAKSGNALWKVTLSGGIWEAPVIKEGVLYLGDSSGDIYGLSARDGSEKFKIPTGSVIVASPAIVSDHLVFVTEKAEIMEIGFDGAKISTRSLQKGKIYSTPQIGENQMLVAVNEGDKLLYSYDLTGNEMWSFVPGK